MARQERITRTRGPKKPVRDHSFELRLSKDERTTLDEYAAMRGLTASDVVRQWIRDDLRAALTNGNGRKA